MYAGQATKVLYKYSFIFKQQHFTSVAKESISFVFPTVCILSGSLLAIVEATAIYVLHKCVASADPGFRGALHHAFK